MRVAMLSEKAMQVIKAGSITVRVKRSGMYQRQTFRIRKIELGKDYFVELYLPKVLDMSGLQGLAEELGLPVEAENGRAFPEGKGAKDFMNL